MRRVFFILSAGLILWAAAAVPLPLSTVAPSAPTPVTAAIEVRGEIDELTGDLLITTVAVRASSTIFELSRAALDRDADIVSQFVLFPPDEDPEQVIEQQREIFRESVRVATAIGLELAGREVTVTGDGAEVAEVIEGGAAEGILEPGDVIVGVSGEPVRLASELQARTGAATSGDVLSLVVLRAEDEMELEVEVDRIPGTQQVGLGVLVRTLDSRVEFPEGVDVDVVLGIGGPSAGLILALAVYDLFSDVDLLAGRMVAGTGTVTPDGRVGNVGGIDKKVIAAERVGAAIFLVPAGQAEIAREAAPEGIEIVPIETVADAIAVLTD